MASNSPGDIITPPSGGGALQGIGKSFLRISSLAAKASLSHSPSHQVATVSSRTSVLPIAQEMDHLDWLEEKTA